MSLFSRIDRHSGLVGKMANTLGADLVGAAVDGRIPETAIRSAVFGCMSCEAPEACESWLKDHASGSETAPDYCRNKSMLERLRQD